MTEREREMNFALQMVQGILAKNNLILTTDLKTKGLVVIDGTTGKEYVILDTINGGK